MEFSGCRLRAKSLWRGFVSLQLYAQCYPAIKDYVTPQSLRRCGLEVCGRLSRLHGNHLAAADSNRLVAAVDNRLAAAADKRTICLQGKGGIEHSQSNRYTSHTCSFFDFLIV